MPYLLEFLIPAYKRTDGVVLASLSVAQQVVENNFESLVLITVVDDASPNFSKDILIRSLGDKAHLIHINVNSLNKGMSRNIFDMTSSSNAEFCTVLTDDDWLLDGKLVEIVEYLRSIVNKKCIGGLYTPRYSYLGTGELHCVVCKPFSQDRLIENGPVQAMKYCEDGFILTGFIFRPAYFARKEWSENIGNAFFPVINFGIILSRYSLLYVDRNWFHHTVLNVCHWEAWGEDQFIQRKRLYRDYMDAVSILARSLISYGISSKSKISIVWYEYSNYLSQFRSKDMPLFSRINGVSWRTRQRLAFKISVVGYPIYIIFKLILRGIFVLNRIIK